MSGHKMRILSSENDASVKVQQDQNTNITLKLEQPQLTQSSPSLKVPMDMPQTMSSITGSIYPPGQPPQTITPNTPYDTVNYPSAYSPPINNFIQDRDIDITEDITDKNNQIKVLEALLACYENNPIMINKLVVCSQTVLMDIIKTLCNADKVEFIIDEDHSCSCCNTKYIYISKILVTSGGKTQEFKYGWNEKYSLLQKHGISLKICY